MSKLFYIVFAILLAIIALVSPRAEVATSVEEVKAGVKATFNNACSIFKQMSPILFVFSFIAFLLFVVTMPFGAAMGAFAKYVFKVVMVSAFRITALVAAFRLMGLFFKHQANRFHYYAA